MAEAGLSNNGQQAREIGRTLRTMGPALATGYLLARLAELPGSGARRFAIEMLTEIHQHSITTAAQAA